MGCVARVETAWAALDERCKVAIAAFFLGAAWASGVALAALTRWTWWGLYTAFLAWFHFSEFVTTAIFNKPSLSIDSFLLNHSAAYTFAAMFSWAEYWIEVAALPRLKVDAVSYVGLGLVVMGQAVRTLAMFTAGSNFTHIIAEQKRQSHRLVTHGIYSFSRHPSYMGWFWWSIGTQLLLCNPVSAVGFAVASWKFFADRIPYEEETLHQFFGKNYAEYSRRVPTRIPLIA